MVVAGDSALSSLEYTPSWALATVCFIIVSISIILEHSIHLLTNWLKRHRKTALYDAVGRLKSELMLLGFMSLLLAVTQVYISKICVPSKAADMMLPCRKEITKTESLAVYRNLISGAFADLASADDNDVDSSGGKVYETAKNANATDTCSSKGKVSLVTQKGIQQLQNFIFVLAVTQIVYSVLTMALGRAKMRRWKAWERETQTTEYQIRTDLDSQDRRRLEDATVLVQKQQYSCGLQFFNSVAKVDYLTLRHGFIMAHLSSRLSNFDFQKYIEHSLDEDFAVVVSISPLMWFLVVVFMLVAVHGWLSYFWISYVPLLIVLVLGTKLEVVVAKMALQLKNKNNVIVGAPLVKPNDNLFWFRSPRFVLNLLHFTLFLNAFELAFFVWVSIQFGLDSCYHERRPIIATRIVLAVTVQVVCSYITLPLYALVTQMGSEFKGEILKERTAQVLKQWHAQVRDRRKQQQQQQQQQHILPPSLPTDTIVSSNDTPTTKVSPFDPPGSVPARVSYISNICEITEVQEQQS